VISGWFPSWNCPARPLLTLLVFVHAECPALLDAQFISGTVERPIDKKTSQCFAVATDASSHPISSETATSQNSPSASSICLPGAANVLARLGCRDHRFQNSFRFCCTATLTGLRNFISNHSVRLEVAPEHACHPGHRARTPRTFVQCLEIRGTSTDMGWVDIEWAITDDTFTMSRAECNGPPCDRQIARAPAERSSIRWRSGPSAARLSSTTPPQDRDGASERH
jgi:hypothetical protein